MSRIKKAAWTWAFEEGVLTVDHWGKTTSLGRYATRDHAARAAAIYIAGHAAEGESVPPR
jgi:hypothetical protein